MRLAGCLVALFAIVGSGLNSEESSEGLEGAGSIRRQKEPEDSSALVEVVKEIEDMGDTDMNFGMGEVVDSTFGVKGMDINSRGAFLEHLISSGLGIGIAEVTAMALGEDEIDNLPPQMVQHLIAAILSLESLFKALQTKLAFLNANSQMAVQHILPIAQTKIQMHSNKLLSHVGHRYGNSALVKRISQALSMFLQRQLADPFPWTY